MQVISRSITLISFLMVTMMSLGNVNGQPLSDFEDGTLQGWTKVEPFNGGLFNNTQVETLVNLCEIPTLWQGEALFKLKRRVLSLGIFLFTQELFGMSIYMTAVLRLDDLPFQSWLVQMELSIVSVIFKWVS